MKMKLHALTMAASIGLFAGVADAATLTSTFGVLPTDASCIDDGICANQTPTGIGATLTGGWISSDLAWTHNYAPIIGTITSASLELDLLDADSGSLTVRQNTAGGDDFGNIDPPNSSSTGTPGVWKLPGFGLTGVFEGSLSIASIFFTDLQDGSVTFYGDNNGMSIWGVNQATLTIEYTPSAIPLPATLPLLAGGLGLFGLMGWRRKRKASTA